MTKDWLGHGGRMGLGRDEKSRDTRVTRYICKKNFLGRGNERLERRG